METVRNKKRTAFQPKADHLQTWYTDTPVITRSVCGLENVKSAPLLASCRSAIDLISVCMPHAVQAGCGVQHYMPLPPGLQAG